MDLKADKKSLRNLLAVEEQQFRIPPYQRPYSWTFEQVDDLWEDLKEHAPTGHFLGSIVMSTEDEDRPLVIDGQQRLTTLMLLMSALRDECHERSLTQQVQRIDRRLTADDLADGDAYYKFKTGSANWPVFRDFVMRNPVDPHRKSIDDAGELDKDSRARNRPLLDNLARLRGHVTAHLNGMTSEEQAAWLQSFDKVLVEKVELVVIEVRDLADAFLLFETLNDRGLQLSAADLLKSHLLGQIAKQASDEDVDEAAGLWDKMLEDLGANVDVSRFLRHYLLGSVQQVKKDEVFGHFKSLVSKRGASWVLSDLRKAAISYGEFENPSLVSHEPTHRVLADLQTLRASVCYIALLPARRFLSEADFVDFARLTEVLTYRYSSVVGLGTNDIERKYRDAAQLLNQSNGAKLEEARAVLVAAMPDSEQFRVAFARLSMGTQYLLRYTLRKIEESLAYNKEQQLKAASLVHIEHIMPQRLSEDWIAELGQDALRHPDFVNRWGNLTLFFAGLNIPASNKGFVDKKAYYQESQVELTQRLMDYQTWGLAQIEERQAWLAEVADAVWARPEAPSASAQAPEHSSAFEALTDFERELESMWPAVQRHCVETSAEEIKQLAELLPGHLEQHALNHGHASALAKRLEWLLSGWEELDAGERAVLRGAVSYFLEVEDAAPDMAVGGLVDDEAVIFAAESVLAPSLGNATDGG